MSSPSPRKRKQVGLIVLSAVDVITGVLSLVVTALSVQIIALIASGATLFKAVKIAVQSEKAAVFVKPVAIYAVRTLTRSEKMKGVFAKIRDDIKHNPVTMIAAIIELAICGVVGYSLLDFVDRFAWAVGWKAYAVAFGAALLIYAVLVVFTVYLGHDNSVFAAIRKVVKSIGGEKAVDVLDKAEEEVKAAIEAQKQAEEERAREEARIAEEKARDEEIYAKIMEEEEAEAKRQEEIRAKKEEAIKAAKIAAYKAAHPEIKDEN